MSAAFEAGRHRALREAGCRRLLKALRETGVVTVTERRDRGGVVYWTGEGEEVFYVLTAGAVKLFRSYPGYHGSKGFVLLLGPWDVFGGLCSAGGAARWTRAEAAADCEMIRVPKASMEQAIRKRPEVALETITLLERRLVEYEELIERLLSQKTEVRLAKLLPILTEKFGEGRQPRIGLRLTRSDLAAMTAATRESVTGVVNDLREKGVIEIERGHIVLLDPEALAQAGNR